ncbi:putative oxidoreductase YcjS [Variovorax sp. SRS16]|uniref:Gfo/Idh/MocA family protein n=1 Tax=Variovorax sp. SRS16 TaxID=282217 RepID=UPI001315D68F|nr:Gfo/Idh/MocA family oxidoreductase [Variovorax sp. SRS16]VTU28894.1 putative oxidoreductase YcjS [Variovorax sp. SRS16]
MSVEPRPLDPRSGRPLRVALIGCGEHATNTLLPALQRVHAPAFELVALCDADIAAASALARRHRVALALADVDALLRCELDGAFLCATPSAHQDLTRRLLEAGVHVFVEKPPASSHRVLAENAALAERLGLHTQVGHNFRHAPIFRRLREHLARHPLRSPALCVGNYVARWPREDRWNSGSVAKSFLLTHGAHLIDLVSFLFGPMHEVESRIEHDPDSSGVLITMDAQHAAGLRTRLQMTNGAPRFGLDLSIFGDGGDAIRTENFSALRIVSPGEARDTAAAWQPGALDDALDLAGYVHELQCFLSAVAGGPASSPTLREAVPVYTVLDAIVERAGVTASAG